MPRVETAEPDEPEVLGPPARRTWRLLSAAVVAVAVAWFLLVALWGEAPFTLTFDDAYYYFGIARNIAAGHGSTFDGINPTNGYHPLWMGICVVAYVLGLDDLAAARALLLVQVVAGWGVTTALVARLVARTVGGWRRVDDAPERARRAADGVLVAVFVLVVVNPFLVKTFVNGLESAVVGTVDAALLLVLSARTRYVASTTDGWRLGVGVLLALAFLARTDAAFLLAVLGLWAVAEAVIEVRSGRCPLGRAARALAELFVPAALTATVYLVLNQRAFGTPVQVSGLVKRATLDAATLLTFAVVVVVAAAIAVHTFRRTHGHPSSRPARFPLAGTFVVRTGWFAAFALLTIGYYNVLQTQQWLWYYAPALLYLIVVFLLAVADIISVGLASTTGKRAATPIRALAPVLAIFGVPLVIALVLQSGIFFDPSLRSIQIANQRAGEWIRANVAPDTVLASWDAGVVGYFSHARVVNIDGVVNSLAYEQAMRDGTVARFLRCERVAVVTNHGSSVDGHDPDIRNLIRDVYGADAAARTRSIYAEPFRYSGTTNTGGFELSGERTLFMWVDEIPADVVGPRPDDRCP